MCAGIEQMNRNRQATWETVTAIVNFVACGALLVIALLPARWLEGGLATAGLVAIGAVLFISWVTLLAVHLYRILRLRVRYRLHQILILFFVPFMGPALVSTRFRSPSDRV